VRIGTSSSAIRHTTLGGRRVFQALGWRAMVAPRLRPFTRPDRTEQKEILLLQTIYRGIEIASLGLYKIAYMFDDSLMVAAMPRRQADPNPL
jgi:hypothetical protein